MPGDTKGVNELCLFPKKVLKGDLLDPITGELKTKLFFNAKNIDNSVYGINQEFITLPCGKCIECLSNYSNVWAYRIMNECSLFDNNCFITLTYANNPVSLNKKHLQLFLKRLRRKLEPLKIRYFACGEYGSKKNRPHYHLIIFNYKPDDLVYFFTDKSGNNIYKSKFIEKIWGYGFISVGEVSLETAKYTAKYMQKLKYNDYKNKNLVLPFIQMSLKPGIGYDWFLQNTDVIKTDKIFDKGHYISLPRYYLKIANYNAFDLTELKKYRKIKSSLITNDKLVIKREKLKRKFGVISV